MRYNETPTAITLPWRPGGGVEGWWWLRARVRVLSSLYPPSRPLSSHCEHQAAFRNAFLVVSRAVARGGGGAGVEAGERARAAPRALPRPPPSRLRRAGKPPEKRYGHGGGPSGREAGRVGRRVGRGGRAARADPRSSPPRPARHPPPCMHAGSNYFMYRHQVCVLTAERGPEGTAPGAAGARRRRRIRRPHPAVPTCARAASSDACHCVHGPVSGATRDWSARHWRARHRAPPQRRREWRAVSLARGLTPLPPSAAPERVRATSNRSRQRAGSACRYLPSARPPPHTPAGRPSSYAADCPASGAHRRGRRPPRGEPAADGAAAGAAGAVQVRGRFLTSARAAGGASVDGGLAGRPVNRVGPAAAANAPAAAGRRRPPPPPPSPPPAASTSDSATPPSPFEPDASFVASPDRPAAWPTPAYNRYRSPVNVERSAIAAWERDTASRPGDGPSARPATVGSLAAFVPAFLRFRLVPEQVRFAWHKLVQWATPAAAAALARWCAAAAAVDARLLRASTEPPIAAALRRWHAGWRAVPADVARWARALVGR